MELGDFLTEWFSLKAKKDELAEQVRLLNTQLSDLEQDILDRMKAAKLTRGDCEHGWVMPRSEMYPKVSDFDKFLDWVMKDREDRQHFMMRSANSAAVRELFQAKGLLPDGVETYTKESLTTRRNT